MQLTYTLKGESHTLELDGDDVPALLRTAEERLQQRHPAMGADAKLPIRLADALLNSLAENAGTVELGELSPSHEDRG